MKILFLLSIGISYTAQLKGKPVAFIHMVTAKNKVANTTVLNIPIINNNPNAIIVTTPYCKSCCQNLTSIGVQYNGKRWVLFKPNFESFEELEKFNIVVYDQPNTRAFVHQTQKNNTYKYLSILNNPILNNNPKAIFFATTKINFSGTYNSSPIIVRYSKVLKKWCLVNYQCKPFPPKLKVNIIIPEENTYTISLTEENTFGLNDYTISNKQIQDKSSSILLIQTREINDFPLLGISSKAFLPSICISNKKRIPRKIQLNVYFQSGAKNIR